ncbi:putative Embryonic stem cell-specific 5-hydroxymethylcytosine-binding protein [Naja naja]|nr:putative Embryonic stem cell-specific 5-hydroxymethylcytosine-binding protein [Naja naja]
MCGRTAVSLGADRIRRACAYHNNRGERKYPEWQNADKYSPSFNKSPQSNSPVLLSRQHFEKNANSSERILVAMRWGLVPSWFKEADPSKMQYNTSNCRSDTMMEKFCYKVPLSKGKRCVVLADGYYEWQQHNGQKQPYFIYFAQTEQETFTKPEMEDEVEDSKGRKLLTMAGIFDCWEPQNGAEPLYSYSIITVNASECNTKSNASSTVMLNWLKNKGPKKSDKDEDNLPKWSSQFIQTSPRKKSSMDLMHQWLKKDGEPSAKQLKKQ